MNFCAIDFGTSNSAIALPDRDSVRLVELEPGKNTIPTAVFYNADDGSGTYGSAAIASYVDGNDGRLMRSLKSILGSALIDESTDIGAGMAVRYGDVIAGFLKHLKRHAEASRDAAIEQTVLGRPVFFVDDDPAADAAAQSSLEAAARKAGFQDIAFQFEPIAAAFDYEARLTSEKVVLVADIGGGTSDFSVVRVGPERAALLDRRADVLSHFGVHVAGTDFDRRAELEGILPAFGYRSVDLSGREIPHRVYFDLATWHLINTVYQRKRVAELGQMGYLYANPQHYRRLMRVVSNRLGHALMARAEEAKIAVADGGQAHIALDMVESGLTLPFDQALLIEAAHGEVNRIASAAVQTACLAGLKATEIDALYFTGGSTGLSFLSQQLIDAFPQATPVFGDRYSSVATGLGIHARRVFV